MPAPTVSLKRQGLAAVLLVAMMGSAHARDNPHLSRGIRLIEEMEDARAVRALKRALRRTKGTERARVQLYLGIAYFNLLKHDRSKAAFKQALRLDPTIALPATTAPKIRELFDGLRPAPVDVEPPPPPRPPPAPEPVAAPAPRPSAPPPPAAPPPRADRAGSSLGWAAWGTAGLAVAAAGGGLAAALLARSANEESADLTLTGAEADARHDAANSRALAANVLFGVAGAAAIASAVLFYLHLRDRRSQTSATLVPLPGGAALRFATW